MPSLCWKYLLPQILASSTTLTTFIRESDNDADLDSLLHLAQRLGVKVTITSSAKASDTKQTRLINKFAGSWQSEKNGTELARQIQEDHYFRDRDVEL